ncbi:MAG: protein kinase [Eubacteriales bacterium]|nr:protein kinase [Eubacteriales bacterium]
MDAAVRNSRAAKTVQAGAWNGRATIPAVDGISPNPDGQRESGLSYTAGDRIGKYLLTKYLCTGAKSVLFLGEGRRQERVVVKIYEPGTAESTPALRRLGDCLRRAGCASLMPILYYGDLEGGIHYEVMPVYQQGTLENAVITEEEMVRHILPQLNDALRFLGENHLVHNDVKPANIFWKDRGKMEVVLGDYDCLTTDKEGKAGGTPLYMAPERIYSDGAVHTAASDYCSLGLTLITLLSGRALLDDEETIGAQDRNLLRQRLYRRWQRPVSCPPGASLSAKTRSLLNGMIQYGPDARYGSEYITSWIANGGIGVRTYTPRTEVKTIRGLAYRDKLILDIPGLIQVLGEDWKYGCAMLAEHQLDDFVRQFDGRYYDDCQECAGMRNTSAGLFMLMQKISPSADFYWLGEHYRSLEDFVDRTDRQGSYGAKDPFSLFCRAKLLSFYEKQGGASPEQISRAMEIEEEGRKTPELAVKKLQISLRQKPDFQWHGVTLLTLEDLLGYLETCGERLDEEVAELYGSKAFKVWLDYIQHGSFLAATGKLLRESGI